MKLNLKKPLAVFDLETTGINVSTDRIVEISIVKILINGETITKTRKVNPTIPIPKESSMIHGIYDKDVKDEPTFANLAKDMATFLEGCDLAGFNLIKFDVPLLMEEFHRVDIDFDISKRKIVDAQKIFHMMEKRNLSGAYKFYCGKNLENAHSAEADTIATMEVLMAQVEKYEGMPVTDLKGNELGTVENDINALHQLTAKNMVDLAGRFSYNSKKEVVFNFGKHRFKRVSDVLKAEPGYYDWMMRGDFPQDTKRKLTKIKLSTFNDR